MKNRNAPGRCNVTGNLCGTDTWMQGFPCQCGECQVYLRRQKMADDAKQHRDGVLAIEATIFDKFDPRNPNVVASNDDN